MKDVLTLAQDDTRLPNNESVNERSGPCPNPDCRCQTDGFRVKRFYDEKKDRYVWKFMCRGCYDAAEWIPGKERKRGWGDEIDYLRHYRHMSFTAAKNYLAGQVDTALDRVYSLSKVVHHPGELPGESWQEKYKPFVSAAADRLWTPEGQAGLDYLRSRGLNEDTIRKARLGYAVRNLQNRPLPGPCIVLPWYDRRESGYWRVSLRTITPGIPKEERYKHTLPGFHGDGMYLGDSLKRKLPTFLVEGEFDALCIMQAASDLVNVVATGSTGNAQVPKWEGRLARMPAVLVSFDREKDKGDRAAQYWLDVLNGATTVLRYRPLAHDVNDMLMQGYDVRSWVLAALDYLSDQDAGSTQSTLADSEPAFTCSVCGSDLTDVATACYSPDGAAFCGYDESGAACCLHGHDRTPIESYKMFKRYVDQLAAGLYEQTGEHWTVTPLSKDYTREDYLSERERRKLEEYKQAITNGHIQAG